MRKYAIQYVNVFNEGGSKIWVDDHTFDTVEEAMSTAQASVRCSQHLVKKGKVFYRIVIVEGE